MDCCVRPSADCSELRGQRCADVDGQDDVGAHFRGHLDRQVGDQAAIAEDLAVPVGGREDAWHGHRGAQGPWQVAVVQHPQVPVSMLVATARKGMGNSSNRGRCARARCAVSAAAQATAGHGRQAPDLAVARSPSSTTPDSSASFIAAPLRAVLPGDLGREDLFPIDSPEFFQLFRAHAAGVKPPTIAPIEVPTMSTGTRASLRTSRMPTWAMPGASPDSTSAMQGGRSVLDRVTLASGSGPAPAGGTGS